MEQQLRDRLAELAEEFRAGQKRLDELEAQELRLRETLLRISGGIQVLQELLAKPESECEGQADTIPLRRAGAAHE